MADHHGFVNHGKQKGRTFETKSISMTRRPPIPQATRGTSACFSFFTGAAVPDDQDSNSCNAAATALRALLAAMEAGNARSLDALIVLNSLPYPAPVDIFRLTCGLPLSPQRLLTMGSNCTAALDGLWIGAGMLQPKGGPIGVLAADHFGQVVDEVTISQKPSTIEWRTRPSCLLLSPRAGRLKVLSLSTACAPGFAGMSRFQDGHLRFDDSEVSNFLSIDLDTEIAVIEAALDVAAVSKSERLKVAVTNRSERRTSALRGRLDGVEVFSSRGTIGHTGSGDIIENLSSAVGALGDPGGHVLCSANGLGYGWAALLLSVDSAA